MEQKPIPPADPQVGFKTRAERAIEELEAAIKAAAEGGVNVAPYLDRIRAISA